jgi:pimeloyl-ACP methyl ester carboxylesterase
MRTDHRRRLLSGLDVEERHLEVDGISTSVLEAGVGAPLILVHGGIECGGVYWAPVIPALAERHHVIVPDVPGLGESAPAGRLDDDTFGSWLRALIAATCDRAPAVIAHSLLGSLTGRFAVDPRTRLSRLTIYGAPGIGDYRMPLRLRWLAIRFGLRPNATNAERFERFALLDLDRTRDRDPGWYDAFSAYTTDRARVPHVKRTMRELISAGTERIPDAALARIDAPVTVLWGTGDRMVPVAPAREASERFGWPLRLVAEAAHVPHIEQPDRFIEEALR